MKELEIAGVFQVECHTLMGERLVVTGNCPELGLWEPHNSVELETDSNTYPLWKSKPVTFSIKATSTIEYKFIICGNGQATWEAGFRNRSCLLPSPKFGLSDMQPRGDRRFCLRFRVMPSRFNDIPASPSPVLVDTIELLAKRANPLVLSRGTSIGLSRCSTVDITPTEEELCKSLSPVKEGEEEKGCELPAMFRTQTVTTTADGTNRSFEDFTSVSRSSAWGWDSVLARNRVAHQRLRGAVTPTSTSPGWLFEFGEKSGYRPTPVTKQRWIKTVEDEAMDSVPQGKKRGRLELADVVDKERRIKRPCRMDVLFSKIKDREDPTALNEEQLAFTWPIEKSNSSPAARTAIPTPGKLTVSREVSEIIADDTDDWWTNCMCPFPSTAVKKVVGACIAAADASKRSLQTMTARQTTRLIDLCVALL